jgi:hypothetical protein
MILVNVDGASINPPILVDDYNDDGIDVTVTFVGYENTTVNLSVNAEDVLVFKQPVFNGLSENSAKNINKYNVPSSGGNRNGMAAVGYKLQFVEEIQEKSLLPEDPAVWETEPKDSADLDIYYEISGRNPIRLDASTIKTAIPIGAKISCNNGGGSPFLQVVDNYSNDGNVIRLSEHLCIHPAICATGTAGIEVGDIFHITKLDGSSFGVQISTVIADDTFSLDPFLYNSNYQLNWHNCYSFGNGVESNRIRDNFNLPYVSNGVKVSSSLEDRYEEERREYGLIYSGVYNSTSGVNSLNQFIQAEKITKDVNPTYGSIQKLHSRSTADGDLITLCEDRILKILANKDAVYNADGNPQLTANENVLGQAIPFSGEYGISTNPESFASENYRVYFTDKVRGAVMRLSKDGLTPISDHGMKDWFRDNLKLNTTLIGSYDDKKEEYNISLKQTTEGISKTVSFREDVRGWVSFKSFTPENAISCANEYYSARNGRMWQHNVEQFITAGAEFGRNTFYGAHTFSTFNVILNDVPGSVKSFNTINYEGSQSKVDQLLTDGEYHNLHTKTGWYVDSISTNKETGTINEFIEKEGKWFNYIKGQKIQHGGQHILINPDGSSTFDQASFAIQGIGLLTISPIITLVYGCTNINASNYESWAQIDDGSCIPFIYGCMEPTADNYNSTVNTDDGSCIWSGCTINDGSQVNPTLFPGIAYNYSNSNSIFDDGSCVPWVFGCTDPTATNYNPLANTNATSSTDATSPCIPYIYGCMILLSDNYNTLANTDDGTCTWLGCTNALASNYGWFGALPGSGFSGTATSYAPASSAYGIQNNAAACMGGGCTDPTNINYDPTALFDDGTCLICSWPSGGWFSVMRADESSSGASDGQIAVYIDPVLSPYSPLIFSLQDSLGQVYTSYFIGQGLGGVAITDSVLFSGLPAGVYDVILEGPVTANGSCIHDLFTITVGVTPPVIYTGCTDATACNYEFPTDPTHVDDGSCEFVTCAGCTEVWATDQNPNGYLNTVVGAFNTQTGTATNCTTPGINPQLQPCTIQCGDGTSASAMGTDCCSQTITGCFNPIACNAIPMTGGGNFPIYDNDDALCVFSGCMDASLGMFPSILGLDINGNACVFPCQDANGDDIGYSANNYAPCATVPTPWTCVYDEFGCTDPTACNYNPAATIDDSSCLLGFISTTIGDPNTVDGTGAAVGIPVFYYDGAPNITDTIKHHVSTYPVSGFNVENDVGLSIRAADPTMAQYLNTDSVRVRLYKEDVNGAWQEVYTTDLSASVNYWETNSSGGGATYGMDRVTMGNYDPHPFGPTSTSSSNYEFDIYTGTTATKQQYAVEITSMLSGIEYGKLGGATPLCGLFNQFQFNDQPVCSLPGATNGCIDSGACNYDAAATCDDGSCVYGPGVVDPNLGYNCVNGSCVQPTGCQQVGFPAGFMPPTFSTQPACQSMCFTGGGS